MIRRRVFSVASAISLLLCVVTVALWVRSYRHLNELMRRTREHNGSQRQLTVAMWRGSFLFTVGVTTGEITEQRFAAQIDGYFQLTPHWRYMWADRTEKRPSSLIARRLGFGRDQHSFWAVEPPPVGEYGTFVTGKVSTWHIDDVCNASGEL
jgi:hypothetical protein